MDNGMAVDATDDEKLSLLGGNKSKILGEMKNQFSNSGCSSSENDLLIDEDVEAETDTNADDGELRTKVESEDKSTTTDSSESNEDAKPLPPGAPANPRKPSTRHTATLMEAPKRSARRRSKDCNESVLQSAIARKEKSYNESDKPQRLTRRLKPTQKILDNLAAAAKKDKRRKPAAPPSSTDRKRRSDLVDASETRYRRSGRLSTQHQSESDESDAKGAENDVDGDAEMESVEEANFSSHLDADSATAQLIASRVCVCTSPTKYTPISELNVHCNAMDSISNRLIGCNNAVDREQAWMLRPSTRVPYMVLCSLHRQRLRDHHCCAMCGVFCTQGAFLQCARKHLYHTQCKLTIGRDLECCPHCGASEKHAAVTITMETSSPAVYTRTQCTTDLLTDAPSKPPAPSMPPPAKKIKKERHQTPPKASSKPPVELKRQPHDEEDVDVEAIDDVVALQPSKTTSDNCEQQIIDLERVDDELVANLKNQHTVSELLMAIKKEMYAEVATLLGQCDHDLLTQPVNVDGVHGTVLHYAARHGLVPIMHMLKIADMDLNVVDSEQSTALMAAVEAGQQEAVRYLASAGASVTVKGTDGMTALHLACKCGNLAAAKQLLVAAAHIKGYINLADDGGWTPLVWACEHSHVDVVKHLLAEGADPQLADVEGNVALHWAAFSGSTVITELIVNYGARLDAANDQGDTALHVAARQDNYDCISLLVTRGASLDIRNENNETALDCAPAGSKSLQVLQYNSKLQVLINHKK